MQVLIIFYYINFQSPPLLAETTLVAGALLEICYPQQ